MIISPFTPLFFLGARRSYGIESPFVQFFSIEDTIRIQVIRSATEPSSSCKIAKEGGLSGYLMPSTHIMGDGRKVDTYLVDFTDEGYYRVTVGDEESEPFEVTSNQTALERSVLMEYCPADNANRNDVVGEIDGVRQYFSFRVPGGFKDSAYDFSVDNEQFTAQTSDIVELYSRESMQETLTVGWSRGVPIWFGQLLNRLLTSRYVYLDKRRYARYQSSVPEKTQTMEGVNSFVFTQKLQRINHLEPTKQ